MAVAGRRELHCCSFQRESTGATLVGKLNRRNTIATAVCASSLVIFALRARPQSASQAQQRVETPMATDERLQILGWWPTKRSASREDYVGTAECARCHTKKTSTQVTTPMAHAAMPAAKSDILREHPKVSLQLGPYHY